MLPPWSLLQGAAHDHVVHLARIDAGALDRLGQGVAAQSRPIGVVEAPRLGPADGVRGGGDDNGFAHSGILVVRENGQVNGASATSLMWNEKPSARGPRGGLIRSYFRSWKRLPSATSFSSRAAGLKASPIWAWNSFILASTLVEADMVAVPHGAAAIDRPAVAVLPDHIDVRGADGLALFEDLRALIIIG